MAEQQIKPGLKAALEYGPLLVFFIAYLRLKGQVVTIAGTGYDGFIIATALFIPLMVASTLILWRLTGHLSRMQVMTLVLVVLFGGLTVWLNDPRFFKMKPTILYVGFGVLLGIGLLRGQSWLKSVMGEALPLQDEGWMILTRRFCMVFFALAAANEIVWRSFSEQTWVYFKIFGMPVILFGFMMTQAGLFSRYGIEQDTE